MSSQYFFFYFSITCAHCHFLYLCVNECVGVGVCVCGVRVCAYMWVGERMCVRCIHSMHSYMLECFFVVWMSDGIAGCKCNCIIYIRSRFIHAPWSYISNRKDPQASETTRSSRGNKSHQTKHKHVHPEPPTPPIPSLSRYNITQPPAPLARALQSPSAPPARWLSLRLLTHKVFGEWRTWLVVAQNTPRFLRPISGSFSSRITLTSGGLALHK